MKNEGDWVTGRVKLSVEGHPLDMEMTVPAKPVTIRTMLPVFQQMSNSFVQIGIDAVEGNGEEISCKKGCGACCRQPVPVSEAEAYQIAELVEEMSEPRRSEVRERFQKAFEHFAEIGWFEKLEKTASMPAKIRQQTLTDYFHEGIPCPFLEDESCSIHQNRPTVCREYLVTSPAENCQDPTPETIRGVPLPIKPSATLCAITKSDNLGSVVNFVPLILSLVWVDKFPENKEERTGEQWMAEFFKNLTKSEIPQGKNSG
jgi:Fe-S-cluster containining protein